MVIKAIVFDFDGVLADSEPLHLRAYQQVLSRFGVTLSRDDYYTNYLGYDDEGVFAQLTARHGIQVDDRGIRELIDEKTRVFDTTIEAGIESGAILYPGAAACIELMASRYPLGIASGALRHEIEAILRGARLEQYFQFIVASGETAEGKPAPDPYRRAAELHSLPASQCVAIEDSRWGIESAKSAGLACVGITTTYSSEYLTAADRIIASLDEFTPDLVDAIRREAR
jgi:HAD superfamily hydrolase (TIGR01509 family)